MAFVNALGAIGGYVDTGYPMKTWFYRIMHNLAANKIRDESRKKSPVSLDSLPFLITGEQPGDVYERKESQVEAAALANTLLGIMPKSTQQVFELLVEGETYEQTGRILGIKPGAAKSRVHRFKKKARKFL